MRAWHYTTHEALEGIFIEGKIRRDRIYLKGEIPGVWMSTNENWEETVRKSIRDKETSKETSALSRDALYEAGFIPIRIEINPNKVELHDWKSHCKKIPKKIVRALESAAKEWGANPDEWRVSYNEIPVDCFLSPIERWDGQRWVEACTRG